MHPGVTHMLALGSSASVRACPRPAAAQPVGEVVMKAERMLVYWGLISKNGRGPYLAGLELDGGTGTSTQLVELDIEGRTALTASGRSYRLQGEPDPAYALAVAKSVWGQYFDLEGSAIEALSPAAAKAMIVWQRNEPLAPAEKAAFAKRHGLPLELEEIAPWDSGAAWENIPDPEDGEDDDLGPVGVVPEVKASLILSIKDSMRQKRLSLSEAACIAGIKPQRLRAIMEQRRVLGVNAEALDRILQAIADWKPEPPVRNDF